MLIKNIRAPYSGETMKNYIAYDIEANEAEIVLHGFAGIRRSNIFYP